MLNVSESNVTAEVQPVDLLRSALFSIMSISPSLVFLYINGTLLFILRSKVVFRETSRYFLLFNLLLGDTAVLTQSQVHFLLSVCKVRLAYSLCTALDILTNLSSGISPLTLVVMPLERYVAVCYPLRHASIVTIRSTTVAVVGIWAVSSLNNLTRLFLLLQFPFEKVERLQIKDVCSSISLALRALTEEYDRAYTCVLFVSAGVAATFSYVGVIVAARSASTDKALAQKARNTLLLHLVQLGLSMSSTVYNPLTTALSRALTRTAFLWVQSVFYVCFTVFPRCLSALVYGLRDRTIRAALLHHLCCRTHSRGSNL